MYYCWIFSPGPKGLFFGGGGYCADLSTSMKYGTDVDENILNSFFEGAEAATHWGHHNCQIQDGRLKLFDSIITLYPKVIGS